MSDISDIRHINDLYQQKGSSEKIALVVTLPGVLNAVPVDPVEGVGIARLKDNRDSAGQGVRVRGVMSALHRTVLSSPWMVTRSFHFLNFFRFTFLCTKL